MSELEDSPAFLTTKEVAALLRVKERKVYDMAAEGDIPCRRLTGKLLFPRVELEAWLAGAPAPQPETTITGANTGTANVIAGSHDPLLDWAIRESGSGMASFFDGSLDGLARVASGEAAAAGIHVFEPERDGWNRDHVASELAGRPVVLVEWAKRQRGLIVAPGLAQEISEVADLRGRRLVQRQATAGTALLMRHLLKTAGIGENEITLLPELARTETDAAAAVAGGQADAALGLQSMARQFGLPFVATIEERFDLVVDRRSWFDPPLQKLLAFSRTTAFAEKAAGLGGYDITGLGKVHWNGA
ncbi:helix-turn-helix transcriptional regulator [Pelagibius litoralis]|uniref:Helix-turn-helix transcriptional regulator n=1 Tax=Pelagibius litoralis TaxID=374515 RepID=A0A967EXP8_9PROT|nr:helix-turn-helix transcriptional regulator [Pelagibius litoralis]NIA69334.1 helix-turn-helix transcriptional regulator [Pelagibius litoralis]